MSSFGNDSDQEVVNSLGKLDIIEEHVPTVESIETFPEGAKIGFESSKLRYLLLSKFMYLI